MSSALAPRTTPADLELKRAFALELLHTPKNPFGAAQRVLGFEDAGRCMRIYRLWEADPEVRAFKEEFLAELGEDVGLASKRDQSIDIYAMASNENLDPELRIKAHKLYADVRGFIDKPSTTVNANVQINQNRVMIIQDHGSNEAWAAKAAAHQKQLLADIDAG